MSWTMDSAANKLSPHARQLQHGLALANRRMMETAAKMERTLILGTLDGNYQERPAAEFHESGWPVPKSIHARVLLFWLKRPSLRT